MSKRSFLSLLNFRKHEVEVIGEVNKKVWREAEKLRKSGEILKRSRSMDYPFVAFHGEFDHHPAEGVEGPLSDVLEDFKFIHLDRCGYYP